ncbi:patatin-like phospholipase family protein [Candidatus Poribacteria bacterium]
MPQKIGLALGGGGARGAAHIGILYELEEHNIPIDLIAGTSVGSIIGAFYAHGQSLDKMRDIFSKIRMGGLRYFRFFHKGIFSAKSVEKFCEKAIGNVQFGELPIQMAAVATDLRSGESVILQEGSVKKALSASSAFLPYFAPVEMDGYLLADGGILSNVPVDFARKLGADTIIAVDLGSVPMGRSNIISIAGRAVDVMIRKITDNALSHADVVIKPDIEHFPIFDFKHCDELIQIGRETTREVIPAIKEILAIRQKS